MQVTRIQPLGWEDPLKKRMATHSSILAWRIQWREESGGLQSMVSQKSDTTKPLTHTHTHTHTHTYTKWAGFPTRKKDAVSRRGKGCQAENYNRYSPRKASRSNLSSLNREAEGRKRSRMGCQLWNTLFFFSPCLISCFPPSFNHFIQQISLLAGNSRNWDCRLTTSHSRVLIETWTVAAGQTSWEFNSESGRSSDKGDH